MRRRTTRRGLLATTAAATALLAAIPLALAATAGTYSGRTSENLTVSFKISGNTIKNFSSSISYNGKCGPGAGPQLTAKAASIPIGSGGRFSKSVTLTINTVRDQGTISGTASGTSVHGQIVELLSGKVNKCYTESFSAHRV
jgi:hypothetical protein